MKTDRLALILTVVNLALLAAQLVRPLGAQGTAPVLRGRGLEIVDDKGTVRAEMTIVPPTSLPDGKIYAETILLRMRDERGRVRVKLDANLDGSGLLLADDSQQPGLHLETKGGAFLEIRDRNGRQQVIKP